MAGSLLTAAHTSSASAICGIASARTNETASIRLTPVRPSRSISAIFAGVGTGSSFCSPSLGPTSRSEIREGTSLMPSFPWPVRLSLLIKRGDALAPVRGQRGGAPRGILHFQSRRKVGIRSLADCLLRGLDRDRRVGRHPPRDLDRLRAGRSGRDDPVGEPDLGGLGGVHAAARENQVSGPARPEPAGGKLG